MARLRKRSFEKCLKINQVERLLAEINSAQNKVILHPQKKFRESKRAQASQSFTYRRDCAISLVLDLGFEILNFCGRRVHEQYGRYCVSVSSLCGPALLAANACSRTEVRVPSMHRTKKCSLDG